MTQGIAAGPKPWMDATEVAETVARLAAEIDRDHPDGVVLIGVLKGSLFFLAVPIAAVAAVLVGIVLRPGRRGAPVERDVYDQVDAPAVEEPGQIAELRPRAELTERREASAGIELLS